MYGSLAGSIDASEGSKEYSVVTYSSLIRNEVLGTAIEDCKDALAHWNSNSDGASIAGNGNDERRSNIVSTTTTTATTSHRKSTHSSANLYTYKTMLVG